MVSISTVPNTWLFTVESTGALKQEIVLEHKCHARETDCSDRQSEGTNEHGGSANVALNSAVRLGSQQAFRTRHSQ